MKKFRRALRIGGLTVLLLLFVTAMFIEWRYGLFRTAPRIDRSTLVSGPGIVVIFDPAKASTQIAELVRERAGFAVPLWAIERALPYEAAIMAGPDHDRSEIDLTCFINPRRLGPALVRELNAASIETRVPEIRWSSEGVSRASPGVVTLEGTVPMEPEAQEAAYYLWNQSFKPTPLEPAGGHLLEVIADNRDGGAYLAVASLLHAYDINLDEKETDISLSSLKFVLKGHLTADIVSADALVVRFTIDVRPDAIDRLGVINLKVGIDELFNEWGARLARDHGITLAGGSRWNDTVMEFTYRLNHPVDVIRLAFKGELF